METPTRARPRAASELHYEVVQREQPRKAVKDSSHGLHGIDLIVCQISRLKLDFLPVLNQEKLKLSLADFDRAIEIAPTLAVAYVNRGSARVAMGNVAAALADYDRAISLNPTMAVVYQNRGIAYLLLGREMEAERDFARCLEWDRSLKPSLERAVTAAKNRR